MWRRAAKLFAATFVAAVVVECISSGSPAQADEGWEGRRRVSMQAKNDLFYNYYVGPYPSGTAAQLYVSPLPVPATVGHTWITYQPFMPHEFLYKHHRSYYTYNPGAGWTRAKIRYHTAGTRAQDVLYRLYH
ncbi:MAG: hypothetical protein WD851_06540 [Pirellulales bacterium]